MCSKVLSLEVLDGYLLHRNGIVRPFPMLTSGTFTQRMGTKTFIFTGMEICFLKNRHPFDFLKILSVEK